MVSLTFCLSFSFLKPVAQFSVKMQAITLEYYIAKDSLNREEKNERGFEILRWTLERNL